MIPVFHPQNETELVLAVGALQAHGIPHFVHNRGFGGLYPGMQMDLYNARTILVPASAYDAAQAILEQFLVTDANAIDESELEPGGIRPPAIDAPRSWRERLRLLVELIVASWCVPRGVRRKSL